MAERMSNEAPIIDTQGTKTNPTTATVMADTGALNSGIYDVLVMSSTDTAGAKMQLEHRNAANDGTVSDTAPWRLSANAPAEFKGIYFIDHNQRIRVMMTSNLTGDAEATLFVQRIS